jgi:isoquinoline 1-oxidoreductase subunit beta
MGKWTRRAFIGTGARSPAEGSRSGSEGSCSPPTDSGSSRRTVPTDPDAPRLTTWIRILPDNRVLAIIPHCEMGQGALTGIAMMLAEELDADWDLVGIEEAPPGRRVCQRVPHPRIRGGGGFRLPVVAGARPRLRGLQGRRHRRLSDHRRQLRHPRHRVARDAPGRRHRTHVMLLEAAAERLDAPLDELTTRCVGDHPRGIRANAHLRRGRNRRRLSIDPVESAAQGPRRLPARRHLALAGPTSRPRSRARRRTAVDVDLPDMVYAAIAAAPVRGATLVDVDDGAGLVGPGGASRRATRRRRGGGRERILVRLPGSRRALPPVHGWRAGRCLHGRHPLRPSRRDPHPPIPDGRGAGGDRCPRGVHGTLPGPRDHGAHGGHGPRRRRPGGGLGRNPGSR